MSDTQFSLFDIPNEPAAKAAATLPELPIREGQVQEIRIAFDRAGIVEQDARKALIESVVMRDVSSLRELRAVEAPRIVKRIEEHGKPKATGNLWDTREEDTWIDKL